MGISLLLAALWGEAGKVGSRAVIKQRPNDQLLLTSCVWRFSLFYFSKLEIKIGSTGE